MQASPACSTHGQTALLHIHLDCRGPTGERIFFSNSYCFIVLGIYNFGFSEDNVSILVAPDETNSLRVSNDLFLGCEISAFVKKNGSRIDLNKNITQNYLYKEVSFPIFKNLVSSLTQVKLEKKPFCYKQSN